MVAGAFEASSGRGDSGVRQHDALAADAHQPAPLRRFHRFPGQSARNVPTGSRRTAPICPAHRKHESGLQGQEEAHVSRQGALRLIRHPPSAIRRIHPPPAPGSTPPSTTFKTKQIKKERKTQKKNYLNISSSNNNNKRSFETLPCCSDDAYPEVSWNHFRFSFYIYINISLVLPLSLPCVMMSPVIIFFFSLSLSFRFTMYTGTSSMILGYTHTHTHTHTLTEMRSHTSTIISDFKQQQMTHQPYMYNFPYQFSIFFRFVYYNSPTTPNSYITR